MSKFEAFAAAVAQKKVRGGGGEEDDDEADTTKKVSQSEIEAWREVHGVLKKALISAREGVAIARAQRRYWMEEICANLTTEGKLTSSSLWKKAAPVRKTAPAKRKQQSQKAAAAAAAAAAAKRKKEKSADDTETEDESSTTAGVAPSQGTSSKPPAKKKARAPVRKAKGKKQEEPTSSNNGPAKKKIKLKVNSKQKKKLPPPPPSPPVVEALGDEDEDDDEDDEMEEYASTAASRSYAVPQTGQMMPPAATWGAPLLHSGYAMHPYSAAIRSTGAVPPAAGHYDVMSHIPEELREFMGPANVGQQMNVAPPVMSRPQYPYPPPPNYGQDSEESTEDEE